MPDGGNINIYNFVADLDDKVDASFSRHSESADLNRRVSSQSSPSSRFLPQDQISPQSLPQNVNTSDSPKPRPFNMELQNTAQNFHREYSSNPQPQTSPPPTVHGMEQSYANNPQNVQQYYPRMSTVGIPTSYPQIERVYEEYPMQRKPPTVIVGSPGDFRDYGRTMESGIVDAMDLWWNHSFAMDPNAMNLRHDGGMCSFEPFAFGA